MRRRKETLENGDSSGTTQGSAHLPRAAARQLGSPMPAHNLGRRFLAYAQIPAAVHYVRHHPCYESIANGEAEQAFAHKQSIYVVRERSAVSHSEGVCPAQSRGLPKRAVCSTGISRFNFHIAVHFGSIGTCITLPIALGLVSIRAKESPWFLRTERDPESRNHVLSSAS